MPTPQTTSFLVRFTQQLFDDGDGSSDVQWRGKISHVQGDDQASFTDFSDVISFMQDKLSIMTMRSVEDKSPEEQDGILNKSLDIWKRLSASAPKLVLDTIKDPKKQVAQIQDQLSQVGDELGHKLDKDTRKWRTATKTDLEQVLSAVESLSVQVKQLGEKVDEISNRVDK
ncbi:MAG: hypothetical protein AAFQ02_00275 [Bacteroidota bacterium]